MSYTLSDLNSFDHPRFVEALGWIFEGSPWVAERAWSARPFADLDALFGAMKAAVETAKPEEQLALLRAHPDLGARVRISAASTEEQTAAGLNHLTPEEFERLQRLNSAYRNRFDFPFLFAVKGSTKYDVLDALERRINAAPDEEFQEALRQVFRIAEFRLKCLAAF
jgi:2-oxo-4-hydroxy-4-carboxy-5-ureidoimidazoline decarboxylase